jgi:hypothetical protein
MVVNYSTFCAKTCVWAYKLGGGQDRGVLGLGLGAGPDELFGGDDGDRTCHRSDRERDQEPQQVADGEEHEDAAVGAFSVTSNAMIIAPVMAPPNIIDGITRSGSAAA